MADPVTLDFESYLADPMATLRAAHGGAARGPDGPTMVVDHAEVRSLLTDDRLGVNFVAMLELLGITDGPFHDWMAISPLNREGDDHRRWRSFMNRTFTPRSVGRVRPFLSAEADRLTAELAVAGRVELMADFADVLPALGLCELIGVPADDRLRFTSLAHTIGYGFRPMELATRIGEVDAALAELLAYTSDLLVERRADPRDDLVSRIATEGEAEGYSRDDCAGFVAGLVFAGNDTTRNQIGWMVSVLIEHPGVWDAIGSGAVAVAAAVEELMRYRSAVTSVTRRTRDEVEIAGEAVGPGEVVMLSLWGAGSDPAAYPAPDDIDPEANGAVPHVAFGHGAHHCLGAALARAELQESLRALTAGLEVPRELEGAEWSAPIGICGPTRLPLEVRTRAEPDEAQP